MKWIEKWNACFFEASLANIIPFFKIQSISLVYSAEEALAETRVQKPKCFNLSERNYY